ncbi:MAG: Ig-like domain-containing protein [Bacteroidota bacterium]
MSDLTPTLTGTAEANSLITISSSTGIVLATGTANASGAYAITLPTQGETTNEYFITSTDFALNVSPIESVTLNLDITNPVTPIVTTPTSGSVWNPNTTPVVGTGEPGTTVTITDGS